jgi:hypothetical protein
MLERYRKLVEYRAYWQRWNSIILCEASCLHGLSIRTWSFSNTMARLWSGHHRCGHGDLLREKSLITWCVLVLVVAGLVSAECSCTGVGFSIELFCGILGCTICNRTTSDDFEQSLDV